MRLLLCLMAKAAARTCSVVFYYAVPGICGKARVKSCLSLPWRFQGQFDTGRWLSIRIVHNG
jgi:hypothetical protein